MLKLYSIRNTQCAGKLCLFWYQNKIARSWTALSAAKHAQLAEFFT